MAVSVRAGAAASAALSSGGNSTKVGKEWIGVLATVPLFAGLSQRHLRRIAALARVRRFESGTVIVRAGRPGDAFYVILDGKARVASGRRRVTMLGAGDFFGEMALPHRSPPSADLHP